MESQQIDEEQYKTIIPEELDGKRFDVALAALFPDFSRSRLQAWIKSGDALIAGNKRRQRDAVAEGEEVELKVERDEEVEWSGEDIPLNIIYEDDHILFVDKAAGMVVHPAAGNWTGTLVNALLFHLPKLSEVPRAGVVHRLDKDTSGILVIAKTLEAHTHLVRQLQNRSMRREYQAISNGLMTAGGTVDAPIGRHRGDRKKMAVVGEHEKGKVAITHYRVLEKFRSHTHTKLTLETGRTHQIRVHMEYVRFALLGDPVYGHRLQIPKASSEKMSSTLRNFKRQALHAAILGLEHPATGEWVEFDSPLPEDMLSLIEVLREDLAEHR
ncbi:MAG: 23S rRNA pseudouridine(1911/1915/1917) synthase RluD [Thiotrichales bacterium]|jgi:23S rRNA pseudouridine1911/1915/1917 synthase|nr:23S rRNA pseudouridine(1911/1915/1917) synthase RluD [Thiotrichales bacterium]MBT3613127.1 23S rRNA pseudouridine(1911/1915/1917) synthase RluD [Thiotrichales bacterium]MBT3837993.1 23S rRNA pseudouridine(1911/1915/1917) synthase RluD [Thiotrichales bacterium]MBT4152196.1 23S rRNA pseudouridine(1911/1915/1917) synthase RluD [Thiotrichales bacterium]MBT4262230.1 23S rRNA pseudouridine(1911/1915/1917) synthase RluD [Thiotrichales bacterium]